MAVRIDLRTREAAQAIREESRKAMLGVAHTLQGEFTRAIRDKGAVASGNLLGSIGVSEHEGTVRIGSAQEYSAYIEHGTRPHFPPIEPIMQWVQLKKKSFTHAVAIGAAKEEGGLPTVKATRRIPRRKETSELARIAYAVQRAIGRRGTRPRHMFKDVLDKLGIDYELTPEFVYALDTAQMLDQQGIDLWQRIINRLK